MTPQFISIVTACTVLAAASANAQTLDALRKEVALLRAAIDSAVTARLQCQATGPCPSVRIDVALTPVEQVFGWLSSLPVSDLTVRTRLVQQKGKLYEKYSGCSTGGEVHLYADFTETRSFKADAWLLTPSANWRPGQGLQLSLGAKADIFIPMIEAHIDPFCPGGGKGVFFGPLGCDPSVGFNGFIRLTGGIDQPFRFEIPASLWAQINCDLNMGQYIPSLGIRLPLSAETRFSGEFGGPLKRTGNIRFASNNTAILDKNYEFELSNVAVSDWQRGMTIVAGASLKWIQP